MMTSTAIRNLHDLQLRHWDAKYDWTLIESRIICCLTSVRPCDMEYWADDTITELFCDIADFLKSHGKT